MQNKKTTTIFVDCFNTIIGRTKHPDDVIFDWSKQMSKTYNSISSDKFFKLFKSCWKELEHIDVLEIENCEFLMNIDCIFSKIADTILKYKMQKNFDKQKFLKIASENYFKAEDESHYLKTKNFKFLEKQKKLGKKIFMVSDFYTTKEILNRWLENLGVKNFFDDIFVSCDFKLSKKAGSLYPCLLKKLHLKPKNVLMFGDNIWSDKIMPSKVGIKTKSAAPYIKLPSNNLQKTKTKLEIPEEYNKIFEDGKKENIYTNYAFPLYLFTKRLFDHTKRHNINEIWFLAREGKFLKTLFEEYIKAKGVNMKLHYFVGSRSSLLNAVLTPYDTRFKQLSHRAFISPHNFMLTLNIPKQKIKSICKNLKLQEHFFHFCFGKTNAYKTLINSNAFKNAYVPYNQSQNEALWTYAKKCGIKKNTKNVFVVDSGWHGSMQQFLGWFLGDGTNLSGCYVGLDTKNAQKQNLFGLLFSKKHKLGKNNKVLSYRMLNYESVLRSPENTCKGYDPKTNTPILDTQKTAETLCYNNLVKGFQEKVVDKFKQIMKVDESVYSNLESVVANMFYRTIIEANNNSRNWYDAVQNTYVDSFGYVGYTYKGFGKFFRKLNYRIRDLNFKFRYAAYFSKKKLFWN